MGDTADGIGIDRHYIWLPLTEIQPAV